MEALTYKQLCTNIEEIADIYDFEITNEVNVHASMKLTGILRNDAGPEFVVKLRNNAPIQIFYEVEGHNRWLFCGTITKSKVVFETDVYMVEIEAKSNTYLLDIHKKSRSFQDRNQSVHQLIQAVLSEYENLFLTIELPERPINQILIQYNETDYEFVKRIASIFNQGILPNVQAPSIALSVGVRNVRQGSVFELRNLTLSCNLEKFDRMRRNFIPNIREDDYLIHEGESYEVLPIGKTMALNGRPQVISRSCYCLNNGLVEGHYQLQPIAGLQQERLYNDELAGTSHTGVVLLAERDQVRVHLNMDETQSLETSVLFPYSTVAASSDGSGWYFMPRPGDQVRVYSPTHDEDIAFAISSISAYVPEPQLDTATSGGASSASAGSSGATTNSASNAGHLPAVAPSGAAGMNRDLMADPNNRYIRSPYGNQMIELTPYGIFISSGENQAKIQLLNTGKVNIFGQGSIAITTTEDITITAERDLLINAKESIKIECEANSSIELDSGGNTTITGFEIKSN